MSLKTPYYNLERFPDVYNPAEDTFLLLDALEKEIPYLLSIQPQFVVEIGSGSGVVVTALAQVFKSICIYFATDINIQACLSTQSTATKNSVLVECLNMDLLTCFKYHSFDVILFNPPYVVTDCREISGKGLERAWAGGPRGRTIIDKVLQDLSQLLSPRGICYMVLLKENNPQEVVTYMKKMDFYSQCVLERKILGEHLYVYKFFRADNK